MLSPVHSLTALLGLALTLSPPHSVLRSQSESESEQQQPARRRAAADGAFEGNAVMWALKKADESLDEIEENPPEYAKTIYEISRGPVGALLGGCLRLPRTAGLPRLHGWLMSAGRSAWEGIP